MSRLSTLTVDIDAAVEGMVLACDLCDAGGNVLLGQGATLSEASLRSLRRRGVEQLQVAGEEEAVDDAAAAAERQRRCERLTHIFRRSADSLATPSFLAQLKRYRCGEAACT